MTVIYIVQIFPKKPRCFAIAKIPEILLTLSERLQVKYVVKMKLLKVFKIVVLPIWALYVIICGVAHLLAHASRDEGKSNNHKRNVVPIYLLQVNFKLKAYIFRRLLTHATVYFTIFPNCLFVQVKFSNHFISPIFETGYNK